MSLGLCPKKRPMTWDIEGDHFHAPAFDTNFDHGDETMFGFLFWLSCCFKLLLPTQENGITCS